MALPLLIIILSRWNLMLPSLPSLLPPLPRCIEGNWNGADTRLPAPEVGGDAAQDIRLGYYGLPNLATAGKSNVTGVEGLCRASWLVTTTARPPPRRRRGSARVGVFLVSHLVLQDIISFGGCHAVREVRVAQLSS